MRRAARAFLAGLAGGTVMSLAVVAAARAVGLLAGLEVMANAALGGPAGSTRWLAALGIHLAISGAIGLLYAAGFERLTRRAGWRVGLAFSVVHALVAGLLLGLAPPPVAEMLPSPGPFMSNLGAAAVAAFVALHLAYGAIVGALYGPTGAASPKSRPDRAASPPGASPVKSNRCG